MNFNLLNIFWYVDTKEITFFSFTSAKDLKTKCLFHIGYGTDYGWSLSILFMDAIQVW